MPHSKAVIEDLIVQLLRPRAAAASICPSEVARKLEHDETAWRALMPQVRSVAADMQDADLIRITRGDQAVTRANLDHGHIRLRRGEMFDDDPTGG